MRHLSNQKINTSKAFGLFELIISLAIISTLVGGVLFYQSRLAAQEARSGAINSITNMVGGIRDVFGEPTNKNYSAVNSGSVISAGLVFAPWRTSAPPNPSVQTNFGRDAGTWVGLRGTNLTSNGFFGIEFEVLTTADCIAIVSRFANTAERIMIRGTRGLGGANSNSLDALLGANAAQSPKMNRNESYNAETAATLCRNQRVIALAFR